MRSTGDPLRRAISLYQRPVTRGRTHDMRRLLDQAAADTATYTAVTDLCRYLNRWDDVGPAVLNDFEPVIQRALAYDPQFHLAHYALGFLRRAQGQHEEALAAFEETIRYAPPTFARVHAQKGEERLYLGDFDGCISDVNRALEINPNSNVRGYFYWVLGRAHFFKQDYKTAIDWLQRSIRGWSEVWYNYAYLIAAQALDDPTRAVRRTRRARAAFDRKFPNYSLAQVLRNEADATPCDNPAVRAGRDRFHEGLRLAGIS